MSSEKTEKPTMVRRIGLSLMLLYGLGTILDAGICALIGKVAGNAGLLATAAFLVAALVAGMTALSYCQLVIRIKISCKKFGSVWRSHLSLSTNSQKLAELGMTDILSTYAFAYNRKSKPDGCNARPILD